ncbi:hypothetical protein BDN72DRAFT_836431 [Pluteus cervinus]|uniref:Uncharacterized protein n=1 Tax=Pluteus cervinus TaxID=181527 RepID=A0ACD3B2F9_9AGAR|nr:hypothetical protein BDN72DRAFT_836431 [Pluteus cervinus]
MDTIANGVHRQVHRPNLLTLPNEIILMILDDSTLFTELLFVGLQCRRLNTLALPLYLSRHGITDPLNNLHVNLPTFDTPILRGLRFSFHITHTENLSCNFSNCPSLVKLLEGILDLSFLVVRLDYVRHVTLTFLRHANPLRNNLLQYWCTVFGRLLTTLVLKGCTSLSIVGGDMFLEAYKLRSPLLVPHPLRLLRKAIKLVKPSHSPKLTGWQFIPQRPGEVHFLPLFPVQYSFHSRLTTVTLRRSPLLLLPPYAQWTFSTLMASPITSFSILDMTIITPGVWPAIFPLFIKSLPKLKHFAVIKCNLIPQSSVYQPLEYFPNLQTFLYDGICDPPPSLSTLPPLSHLTKIYARSDMIINLLSSPNVNLSKLTIIGTHIHTKSRGFNLAEGADAISNLVGALRRHLPPAAFQLPEPQRDQIPLPFKILLNIRQRSHMSYLLEQELSILPFLSSSSSSTSSTDEQPPAAALTTTRTTTRTTFSKFRSPFSSTRSHPQDSSSTNPASAQKFMQNLKSFKYVSGVSFDTFRPEDARDDDWDILIRWLRLFPNLEEVRVGKGVFGCLDEVHIGAGINPQNPGTSDDDSGVAASDEFNLNDELVKDLRSPSQQSGSPLFQNIINTLPRPPAFRPSISSGWMANIPSSSSSSASSRTSTSSIRNRPTNTDRWAGVRRVFMEGCPTVKRIVIDGKVFSLVESR